MAEEPLITESKRPQIKAIIKSICLIIFPRARQENRIKARAIVRASQETQRACPAFN
jgi:hypothetical protein